MSDLIIKNVRVVRPNVATTDLNDIAITDGKISQVAPNIDSDADILFEGEGLLAFPGAVDSHMHFGIYHPLAEDIVTESRAAASGGVTTGLSYIRTGQYYLNVKFKESVVQVPFRILTDEEQKEFKKNWKDIKKEHDAEYKQQ